jgi:phage baseplate assembly protein W
MAHKKLYKEITVGPSISPKQPPSQRIYRGISTVNPDNTNFALNDIGLIKQDLLNHFHISQGEKLENPEFGTIIWDLIHDPMTPDLQEAIKQDVVKIIENDPRIRADSVIITPFEAGIQIEVELTYVKYNVSEKLRLTFDENNGLLN